MSFMIVRTCHSNVVVCQDVILMWMFVRTFNSNVGVCQDMSFSYYQDMYIF